MVDSLQTDLEPHKFPTDPNDSTRVERLVIGLPNWNLDQIEDWAEERARPNPKRSLDTRLAVSMAQLP